MERLTEAGTMLRDRAGHLRGQVEDAVQVSRGREAWVDRWMREIRG